MSDVPTQTQCRPAAGTTGCLIYAHALRRYFFRVYDVAGNFVDYDLLHCDLQVTIDDVDAYFYQDSNGDRLDHAPATLAQAERLAADLSTHHSGESP